MVRRSKSDFDVESFHDILVQVSNKGIAIVTNGRFWGPIPCQPLEEGLADLSGAGTDHGEALDPPACPAEDAEQIFVALRLWEWTHNIQVDCRKSLIWDSEGPDTWVDCGALLGHLTRVAGPDEIRYIFLQAGPVEIS